MRPITYRKTHRRSATTSTRIVPQRVAHVGALSIGGSSENQRLLLRLLSHLGLRKASEFPLCPEALDKILGSRPDLILLDFAERPDQAALLMSGIRRHSFVLNEIPVIAVVSRLTSRGADAVMKTGVNHVVLRPLSPATLYSRVEQAIHCPRPFVKSGGYFGPARGPMPRRPARPRQIEGDGEGVSRGKSDSSEPSDLIIATKVRPPAASTS